MYPHTYLKIEDVFLCKINEGLSDKLAKMHVNSINGIMLDALKPKKTKNLRKTNDTVEDSLISKFKDFSSEFSSADQRGNEQMNCSQCCRRYVCWCRCCSRKPSRCDQARASLHIPHLGALQRHVLVESFLSAKQEERPKYLKTSFDMKFLPYLFVDTSAAQNPFIKERKFSGHDKAYFAAFVAYLYVFAYHVHNRSKFSKLVAQFNSQRTQPYSGMEKIQLQLVLESFYRTLREIVGAIRFQKSQRAVLEYLRLLYFQLTRHMLHGHQQPALDGLLDGDDAVDPAKEVKWERRSPTSHTQPDDKQTPALCAPQFSRLRLADYVIAKKVMLSEGPSRTSKSVSRKMSV